MPIMVKLLQASATIRAAPHVEMEMIVVEGIGVRTQYDLKSAAGGLMQGAQKISRIGVRAIPILLHRDPPAIGEDEGGYIDRIGARMFGQLVAEYPVDRAARIAAETLDFHDRAVEPGTR